MAIDEPETAGKAVADDSPLVTPHLSLVTRLIDQCAYLIDEAEALARLIDLVPDPVLAARPLGQRSVKQILGYLHDMDARVFLPRLDRMLEEDEPAFAAVDEEALVEAGGWGSEEVAVILAGIRRHRRRVVDRLASLPPSAWMQAGRLPDGRRQTVYDLALFVARHDREHLSAIAYRLHEARLGSGR